MFLIACLGVITFAYACSALLAETVFTSAAERSIPAPLRAQLGLLLSIVYFSAAWQLMSIPQSWALGAVLLALYAAGNRARIAGSTDRQELKATAVAHLKGYVAVMLACLVFFMPLIVGNRYGPFTEGGGDVTIYSDTSKLLADADMTSFGQPSPDLRNVVPNLRALLDMRTNDRYVKYAAARDAFIRENRRNLNPPAAESQAYRTVGDIFFSSIFYAPYAQFDFIAGSTNYPAYYGVQSMLYAFLLLGIWYFFRQFGLRAAALATLLAAGSHAIVSVYYNTYSMQGISLAICASMLCALPAVRLFSAAGLRVYGSGTVIVWLCYTHYVSVIAPLLVVATFWPLADRGQASVRPGGFTRSPGAFLLRLFPAAVFTALLIVLLASGSGKSVAFVSGLLKTFLGGARSVYLGDQISPLSLSWMSFLFGFLSQQHLQPFATEIRWVTYTMAAGVVFAFASLLLGIAVMVRGSFARNDRPDRAKRYLAAYVVLLAAIGVHMYMAQSSLYTEAKGAQNVLVLTFAALALPFALGRRFNEPARGTMGKLTGILGITLALYAVTLAVPRLVYTLKLAWGHDRATILEPSYFREAERIRREDPRAFVLFEPRKSGDLYVSDQAFAGMDMVPVRHLALETVDMNPPISTKRILASDLIGASEVPRLWTLSASSADGGRKYEWKARRVAESKASGLYLFADDYERDYGERPRSPEARDVGMFSYLRNGSAMVYMPAGEGAALEVKLAPRQASEEARLAREVSERVAKGEFGNSVRLQDDGAFVTLTYALPKAEGPRMAPVARYSGEYWLNVRLDGKDLVANKEAAAPGHAQVSGELLEATSGVSMRVTWSGIATPGKEDWVGVFPPGGGDASRLAFAFLGAREHGTLTLAMPTGSAGAKYEVRLFRAGSWNPLAVSPVAGPPHTHP
jgi:hypothetical protein